MPRLTNWSVVADPNPFIAPEAKALRLHGNIFEDDRFEDGQSVTTSAIAGLSEENGAVITRSGTQYFLDGADPNYEKQFPDAYARLVATLDRV